MGRLLFFNGTECTKCHEMEPLIEKLEKETGVKVTALETYHNDQNRELLMKITNNGESCAQLPMFYNEDTKDMICGKCDYERLKKWAGK